MNSAIVVSLFRNTSIRKYVVAAAATVAIVIALPFIAVFSMGSGVVNFLAGTPNAEVAASQGFYMGGPIPGNTYAWGNCTYWAYAQRLWADKPIPTTWGNANTWDDNAITDGYEVNHTPIVGAIMQTDAGKWGHVAYVVRVENDTGRWEISEMNSVGLNIVSTRTFAASSALHYNFIHNKAGSHP